MRDEARHQIFWAPPKVASNGADFWIVLQAQYEVAKVRKALGKRLDREVRPLKRAA